jgi:hypothetical protein
VVFCWSLVLTLWMCGLLQILMSFTRIPLHPQKVWV